MSKVLTSNYGIVSFIANLPTTVATTEPYVYYVINEHRYYYTTGSSTASWVTKIYCKIASVRVVSSAITYFKPNLQQNLAQKIGKDKLLFTMSDVNANTNKEFVPSAVAIKEIKDYIVENGSSGNFTWEKWNSGKLLVKYIKTETLNNNTQGGGGYFSSHQTISFPTNLIVNMSGLQSRGVSFLSVAGYPFFEVMVFQITTTSFTYYYESIYTITAIPTIILTFLGTWK